MPTSARGGDPPRARTSSRDAGRTAALLKTAATAAAVLAAGPLEAAWEFVPQVDILADSNDNPRLLTENPAERRPTPPVARRLLTNVRLRFANVAERGELVLEPALRSDGYMDEAHAPLQSTDAYLRSDAEYRSERVAAGYSTDLSRERILGTEFLVAAPADMDVEDPDLVDSLLLGRNERRNRAIVSPYTEIALNDRASLRFESRLINVSYESDTAATRTDFTDGMFGIELVRQLNRRDTLAGRLFGSRFEADENENLTDTAGVELAYSRLLSDAWTFSTTVGAERSEFEYVGDADSLVAGSERSLIFGIGLRKRVERTRLNLDLRRSVNPDSFGFLTAQNELRAVLEREISPRLEGGVAFRFIRAGTLGGRATTDRSYGRLELNLDWDLGPLWALTTAYEYSRRSVDAPGADADSNAISFSFSYRARSRR